jgi:hypothetical protein
MDRRAAEEIAPVLIKAAQDVADTLRAYDHYHRDEDTKPFSDAIGEIVFAIFNAAAPIFAEYPDLAPQPKDSDL